MRIGKRHTISRAISDFRRSWGQLLLIGVVTRLAATCLLLPVLALVILLFMADRGETVISNAEIFGLFLTPPGIAVPIAFVALWVCLAFFEQAALMTIGYGAIEGRRLSWMAALGYMGSKLRAILTLGCHLLVRVLLLVAPFLLAAALVFGRIIRSHDIYDLLFHHPSWFLWTLGSLALLLVAMLFLLSFKVVSWLLAIPAVLFENLGAEAAIKDSVEDSKHHRWQLAGLLILWIALGALAGILGTFVIGWGGRSAIPLAGNSPGGIVFTIGATGVVALLFYALVSFSAAALFALSAVRVYRECSGPGELPAIDAESDLNESGSVRVPGKMILIGAMTGMVLAAFLGTVLLSELESADEVLIIAHRGGMKEAPENTIAAVDRAIGIADYVEIDVQVTADGEIVVFHDVVINVVVEADGSKIAIFEENGLKLKQTEDGVIIKSADGAITVLNEKGKIENPGGKWPDDKDVEGEWLYINHSRLEDLTDINVGKWFVEEEKIPKEFGGETIPTLDQVLEVCKGRMKVMIELKYAGMSDQPNLAALVADVVEDHDMQDEVVVLSFNSESLAQMKALGADWTCGQAHMFQPRREISGADVEFVAVQKRGSRPSFIMRAKRAGFKFYTFTVDDPFEISAMISRGVDGIITNDPALARRMVDLRPGQSPLQRFLVVIGAEVGTFSVLF
jgi:glycerophosphoryl diester phosphodiesterase